MTVAGGTAPAPTFRVRFRGVRGSHVVASPATRYYGGHTSCIEVVAGDLRVVLDCGSGIIGLGDELVSPPRLPDEPICLALLVTHFHADHTMGFPFFKPLYRAETRMFMMGPSFEGREFREVFEASFADPYFPVPMDQAASDRRFTTVRHGESFGWEVPLDGPRRFAEGEETDGLVIRAFQNDSHPNGGCLNFRLERSGKAVVLATDIEGTKGDGDDLVDFARDADVLVHDAQYTTDEYDKVTRGWGHSTWPMACDVAERSGARRLVLFHHDPSHDDAELDGIERAARERFPSTLAACEGLELTI